MLVTHIYLYSLWEMHTRYCYQGTPVAKTDIVQVLHTPSVLIAQGDVINHKGTNRRNEVDISAYSVDIATTTNTDRIHQEISVLMMLSHRRTFLRASLRYQLGTNRVDLCMQRVRLFCVRDTTIFRLKTTIQELNLNTIYKGSKGLREVVVTVL